MNVAIFDRYHYRLVKYRIASWLEAAASHGDYSLYDLERGIIDGTMLGWLLFDDRNELVGVALFEQDGTALHCSAFAGNLPDNWPEQLEPYIRDLADLYGLDTFQMAGRKGWLRKLKHYGIAAEDDNMRIEL